MIPFQQAYDTVMANAIALATERVALDQALHRILAEDVLSDADMPPFNKSAMDGYACRREDLGSDLAVVELIRAGRPPARVIGPGQCAKIMTGAMVPRGADCVFMKEFAEMLADSRVRFTGTETRDNICLQGEDVHRGDSVLHKGDRILPEHIAILASVGCAHPKVAFRPRVGVIATGDELVEPGRAPKPSQIRNSNSYQLCAQVTRADSEPVYYGIAPDTEAGTAGLLRQSAAENHVTLLSGGVSAGDFDLVPGILKEEGFSLLFEKVATKPGMPTVFGRRDNTFAFGLPGNPVSTFVLFELLVKPFLYRLMGHEFRPVVVRMTLDEGIRRRKTVRDSWVPVVMTGTASVRPVSYHGSGHVHALCGADGLICVPSGVAELPEGSPVDVRQV